MGKSTFGKRILEALQKRNIKQIELAEKTGISRGAISSYISGRWIAKQDNIYLIAKALNVNEAWLMGYDVSMEKVHPAIVNSHPKKKAPSCDYYEVQWGIAAGCLTSVEGLMDLPTVNLPDFLLGKYARDKNLVIMHVNGDSMNNVIANGATIVVLTHVDIDNIENGDIIIAEYDTDCECTIKRFYDDPDRKRYVLRPDSNSPAFTDIPISYENANKLIIYGKVVVYNVVM